MYLSDQFERVCLVHGQVVANLLSQQFPNTAIEAVQIAESGEFLSEHLKKAETPGTYDYAALGPESIEKWDYVILQVRSPFSPISFPLIQCARHLPDYLQQSHIESNHKECIAPNTEQHTW